MEIVVCVKQVPDTTEVKIDPVTNTLIREGVPSIVNPFDKYALEMALQLKDKHGGRITALSMGPPQAAEALKECIAMGADQAILLSDRAFAGGDTLATSYTLSAAVRKMGNVDLIICGKQAIDGDTAQVGPEMAEHLGIGQMTYVSKIEVDGEKVIADREQDEGYDVIEAKLPLVVTIIKLATDPRLPTVKGTAKAYRSEIPVWTAADLDIDPKAVGLDGSPTQVRRIFTPQQRGQGEIIQGDSKEAVDLLVDKLMQAKII
jgi:electron transfer flavoprotein alpha/beta subunit